MQGANELTIEDRELARRVGIDHKGAGMYFLRNSSALESIQKIYKEDIEIMDIKKAIAKYDWVHDLRWSLVDKKKDKYTRSAEKSIDGGYFIRIREGAEVTLPLKSCMMITSDFNQSVHNIIISEENSKAQIITGCVAHPSAVAEHIGISEFFVRRNSNLNFTMVHSWNKESLVRPRSAALIEENAHFTSNYICMNPTKDIQMYPIAICKGKRSRVSFNNLISASGDSKFDVGSKVVLRGDESKGEVISRAIATDTSKVYARGMLIGKTRSKAHLECKGLLMSQESLIHAIPELVSESSDSDLSHEAAVGKIARREIEYLMTRGLSEDEAVSTIVRGFMDTSILGLPPELDRSVKLIMNQADRGL